MAKVISFFDHPVLKSILQALIIVVIIGTWNSLRDVKEENVKQNEILIHTQKTLEKALQKLEDHSKDITDLKVDVGSIKATHNLMHSHKGGK